MFDPGSGALEPAPVFRRAALAPGAALDGPAAIVEDQTTTVVPRSWRARIDALGAIVADRDGP